ncbi:organic cation transporter protein-like [Athalia rosae]|uniref:organic cation transporter protein-like n=1 Tax=Athalia rosae TaxID=37344 RepID=UPI0020343755|nr:organic cation transporter protein-like [Athalia rosae]XP_020707373.2 organic cation transporter protein-like [Athalia rosae]
MDFDEVLEELGELGRFQLTNYILVCLPVFFSAANSLSYVFVAGTPDYRCRIEGCDDRISPDYSASWVNRAIPDLEYETGTANSKYVPSHCSMYLHDNATVGEGAFANNDTCPLNFSTESIVQCTEWVFDSRDWTIVGEWNLTCNSNLWKLSLIGTIHFAGIFCGSMFFGTLADRYGRKLMFIVSIMLMTAAGIGQVVSNSYDMFAVFVYLNAVGTAGIYPLAFIIGVELVGRRKRELCGIVLNYFYAVGEAFVALIAWWFGSWRMLQLAVSAPAAIFLCYYWFIPESVRWLLARSENRKAKDIVTKAARANKVVLSSRILESMENATNEDDHDSKKPPMRQMLAMALSSKVLVSRTVIMFYVWAATAFVYYGLSVNSTSLSGDKYWNFALVCLIEIPGCMMALFILPRFGRRISLVGTLMICSITCGAGAVIPTSVYWAAILLFLVGKLAITASFAVLYVYTAELFPTAIRSCVVGCSSTMSRVGAMIAPFAPLLGTVFPELPFICFAAAPFLAAILAIFLFPETKGRRLPETVKEAEAI